MNNIPSGPFKPILKNFDIDQYLMLAEIAYQHTDLQTFREIAINELPQSTRETRVDWVSRFQRSFLEIHNNQIIQTPSLQVWASTSVDDQIKRQLLYISYLRAFPLAWHAVREVVLPHAINGNRNEEDQEIVQEEWDKFLTENMVDSPESTFNRARSHFTAQLSKFGILEVETIPDEIFKKRYLANPPQPQVEVFWFTLGFEYSDNGWTSRSVDFLSERSWSRIAFCTKESYVHWTLEEAERVGLGYSDYFGAEKQFTWRVEDVPAEIASRLTGTDRD